MTPSVISLRTLFEKLFPDHSFQWAERGQALVGLCPFHDDHHPSFTIYPTVDHNAACWKCRTEGIGGGFRKAVRHARPADNETEWLAQNGFKVESPKDINTRHIREITALAHRYMNGLLCDSEEAYKVRLYCERRGVPKDMMRKLAIGYYPGSDVFQAWVSTLDFPSLARDAFRHKSKGCSKGGIVFFYRTAEHTFAHMKLRDPEIEDKVKATINIGSRATPGSYFAPFVEMDDESSEAIIVEGEFDALGIAAAAWKADCNAGEHIYSFSGGANMAQGANYLKSRGIDVVFLFPDNDDAGDTFTDAMARSAPVVRVVAPEDYIAHSDPSEWMSAHTAADLTVALDHAEPLYMWKAKRLIAAAQDSIGKEQARNAIKALGQKLQPTERTELVRFAHDALGGSMDDLEQEFAPPTSMEHMLVTTAGMDFGTYKLETVFRAGVPMQKRVMMMNMIVEIKSSSQNVEVTSTDPLRSDLRELEGALTLEVHTSRGSKEIEILKQHFMDDRKLVNALYQVGGLGAIVKNGYARDIRTAIQVEAARKFGDTTRMGRCLSN